MKRANVYRVYYHVATPIVGNQERSSGQRQEIIAAGSVEEAYAALPPAPEGSENRPISAAQLYSNVIIGE